MSVLKKQALRYQNLYNCLFFVKIYSIYSENLGIQFDLILIKFQSLQNNIIFIFTFNRHLIIIQNRVNFKRLLMLHSRHFSATHALPPQSANFSKTLHRPAPSLPTSSQSGGYMRRQNSAQQHTNNNNGGITNKMIFSCSSSTVQQQRGPKKQESGGGNCDTSQQSTGSVGKKEKISNNAKTNKPSILLKPRASGGAINHNSALRQSRETITKSSTLHSDALKQLITQVHRGDQKSNERQKGNNQFSKLQSKVNTPRNGGINFRVIQQQKQSQKVLPSQNPMLGPQNPEKKGKKTLILDLDETLVHSSFKPHEIREADIILPVELDGNVCLIYVLLRPGALEFCRRMADYFEVVVFTASLSKYAEPLVKLLDPQHDWCSFILFREHCTFLENEEAYVKDLSLLGRNLKDVIILDNSPTSYFFQPENALASKSWYDDPKDRELFDFTVLLQEISTLEDVRPALSQISLEASDLVVQGGRELIVNFNEAMKIVEKHKRDQVSISTTSNESIFDHGTQRILLLSSQKSQASNSVLLQESQIMSRTIVQEEDTGLEEGKKAVKNKSQSFLGVGNMKGLNSKRETSASAKRYLEVARNIAALQLNNKQIPSQMTKNYSNKTLSIQCQSEQNHDRYRTLQDYHVQRSEMESIIESCHSTPAHMTPDLEDTISTTHMNQTQKTKLISELSQVTMSSQIIDSNLIRDLQGNNENRMGKTIDLRNSQNIIYSSINNGPKNETQILDNDRKIIVSVQTRRNPSINLGMRTIRNANEQNIKKPQQSAHLTSLISIQRPHLSTYSSFEVVRDQTPSKQVNLQNTRNYLESNCEIPREEDPIIKNPTRLVNHDRQSSSSINRTPKSAIRQPGQLVEKSGTRGHSQGAKNSEQLRLTNQQLNTREKSKEGQQSLQNVRNATEYMLKIANQAQSVKGMKNLQQ